MISSGGSWITREVSQPDISRRKFLAYIHFCKNFLSREIFLSSAKVVLSFFPGLAAFGDPTEYLDI